MVSEKTLSLPPRIEGHWLTTGAIPIARDFIGWLARHHHELGNIYYAKMRHHPICVVVEPDYARYVLQENNRNYLKSFGYAILQLFLGEGLLTSESEFWLRQRRLAQPAFHRRRLANLVRFMSEESAHMAAAWKKMAAKGDSVEMLPEMMEVTMKIVARALFSANVDEHIPVIGFNLERLNRFAMRRIKSPIRQPMWFPSLRNLVFRQSTQEIDDVMYRIFEERRASDTQHDDLLEMLMEARDEETGEQMNDQQLRDECMTIFVAGHETTATAMTWLWNALAEHPHVFEKLQEELKTVLGGRTPEFDDIPKLKYTRMIVDETLRLYPPAWIIGRKNIEHDTIGGYDIPAGTNVLLSPYLIHRRPDLWERPEEFWPERWATDAVKQLPRMAYFPFGGGPRLCIGNNFALMEMVVLTATLAQSAFPQVDPDEAPFPKPLITLRPSNPTPMKLRSIE